MKLTYEERKQIAEILGRRANEIAIFRDGYFRNSDHYGSVEMALTREIERLLALSDRLYPEEEEAL